MRVAHNITALNAWRNLNQVSSQLGKSVERLSSGYRINKAGDDPAGLVISEHLRAQIVGMDQALANTQDGISMVQTAEGALTEIHSLLDSMRSLALHAANTASVTPEAIAADQEQLDSAIDSINRIATTTAFAGKKLLDGSVGKKAEIKNSNVVASVDVGKANAPGISYVKVIITTAATKAQLGFSGGTSFSSGGETLSSAGVLSSGETTTLNINGVSVTISGGMTVSGVKDAINTALTNSGVEITASLNSAATGTVYLYLEANNYGSDYLIDLYDEENLIVSGDITQHARGTDVGGYFEYKPMYVQKLPIRPIDFDNPTDKTNYDKMVQQVEIMLTLNQKLAISLDSHSRTVLKRQIDATARQIDNLVYQLYNLTKREIEIVEKSL